MGVRIFVLSLPFLLFYLQGGLVFGAVQKESKVRKQSKRVEDLRQKILRIEDLLTKKNQNYIRDVESMQETQLLLEQVQKELQITKKRYIKRRG